MPGLLAAAAVLATFAALWSASPGTLRPSRRAARAGGAARRRSAPGRRVLGAGLGAGAALVLGPLAPGRASLLMAAALPIAGWLAPAALLERRARARRDRLVAALPDALDLLAVGVAGGRELGAVVGDIAARTRGPLARELALVASDIAAGASQTAALRAMRSRAPCPELAALAVAAERSRRYGSPLAQRLREQATALRRDQRRRVEEAAATAAPKIQLVVALVLVPSVLLMILAGLAANSGELLEGLGSGSPTPGPPRAGAWRP